MRWHLDSDTVSIALQRVDGGGTWVQKVDGRVKEFDLTTSGDSGGTAMGASDRWTVRCLVYSVPAASVTVGTTPADDYQDVQVTGNSASSEPVWEFVSCTAPALNDDVAGITLDADSAPGGYTAKVYARHDAGTGWSSWSDITSSLSPSLSAPPTTSTSYDYTTPYTRESSGTLVKYEFRCEILDGSSNVVESQTNSATWYYDAGPV